jgi:hypothetical protein
LSFAQGEIRHWFYPCRPVLNATFLLQALFRSVRQAIRTDTHCEAKFAVPDSQSAVTTVPEASQETTAPRRTGLACQPFNHVADFAVPPSAPGLTLL